MTCHALKASHGCTSLGVGFLGAGAEVYFSEIRAGWFSACAAAELRMLSFQLKVAI